MWAHVGFTLLSHMNFRISIAAADVVPSLSLITAVITAVPQPFRDINDVLHADH